MTKEAERQIKGIIRNQKKLVISTSDPIKRAQVDGAWAGFLDGMKLTGAITNKEYHQLYDEMENSENTRLFA